VHSGEKTAAIVAKQSRVDILKMTNKSKAGFIGSDYSCVDLLSVLLCNCFEEKTDDIVLSKGHGAAALYAVMANAGYINKEILKDFNVSGKNLGVHPKRGSLPLIKTSTGSLGQGIGLASGMALANKIQGKEGIVFAIVGDGEMNEGSVWEIIMFAARQSLDNLVVIIDRNHLQSYGGDEVVLNIKNYEDKIAQFGWNTQRVDGHNYDELLNAINLAKNNNGKPSLIVAETVKGKGVKEFENKVIWHYKYPDEECYNRAMKELQL